MTAPQEPPAAADPVVTPVVVHSYMPPGRRRAALLVLSVIFALWVAALLAMYFREVYPRRHPAPPTAKPASTVTRPHTPMS